MLRKSGSSKRFFLATRGVGSARLPADPREEESDSEEALLEFESFSVDTVDGS